MEKFVKKTLSIILAVFVLTSLFVTKGSLPASASTANYKAGIVSISSGWLNVRSSASTTASIKTSLSKGSYITLVSKSGNWWKVQYNATSYGYCSASYIKEVTGYAAFVNTASTKLNIRNAASTSATLVTQLAKGTSVVILSETGNFYKILYNGVKT